MSEQEKQKLGKLLWDLANTLRGSMDAENFKDYMLGFLFLKYISDHYESTAKNLLKQEYTDLEQDPSCKGQSILNCWFQKQSEQDQKLFQQTMLVELQYTIHPQYLWSSLFYLAHTQSIELTPTLRKAFKYIEEESIDPQTHHSSLQGLFNEINLESEKLGKTPALRNVMVSNIIVKIQEGLLDFTSKMDILGDAYEELIAQFASDTKRKAGEFYTPQSVSSVLSQIVSLDSQNPETGRKKELNAVLDFACGSGSLLLNLYNVMKESNQDKEGIKKIYGQEKNIVTYNLARMNMLLHNISTQKFTIFHGDTLTNDWDILKQTNPSEKVVFDAVVANPPFSYKWNPLDNMTKDPRFINYGVAPKSVADFAFLLHGLHYLSDSGVMAIILPHGVLFRSGVEAKIRTKLIKDGIIDTIIGLPSNLFYNTGIPVCILVLKKCKKHSDILFINASQEFDKKSKQNVLRKQDIEKIVKTYQYREEKEKYSRRVSLEEIEQNDYNLNISRYINIIEPEEEIDIEHLKKELTDIEDKIRHLENNLIDQEKDIIK